MTKEMERMYSHRGGSTRIFASILAVVFTGLLHSADNSDKPVGCLAC